MRREPAGRLHPGLTSPPDPALTGPVDLRGRRAPSRVLFGPHETNLGAADRTITERHVAYYARRAAGGAGVIVTETASVHASDHPYAYAPAAFRVAGTRPGSSATPAPGCCAEMRPGGAGGSSRPGGVHLDVPVPAAAGWAAVGAACRAHGALVLAGLGHAGGQGSTAHSRTPLWGASRVPDVVSREVPVPMDTPEFDALLDGFATAARTAVASGLDGVEIGAGQHSLLRQFSSGLTNLRDDAYGADRSRLLREVLDAVRSAIGPSAILGLRLCVDELAPWAGITPSDGIALAGAVADRMDYLVPVRGSALSVAATRPDMHTAPGFNREVCAAVRAVARTGAGVPGGPVRHGVIAGGGVHGDAGPCAGRAAPAVVLQGSVVDPVMAATALADGVADLVEMTRAQIADPDLVRLVRAGTPERVRPCTLSNQGAARDPRNPVVGDEIEPRSGHETADPDPDGTDAVAADVLVVGGGPAGCEAARTLALRGHRVTLHERSDRLGGALRLAALLPGRGRWSLPVDWWAAELDRLGVDVRLGSEITGDDVAAAAVLVATGSRPAPVAAPGWVPVAEFLGRVERAGSVRAVLREPVVPPGSGTPAGPGPGGPAGAGRDAPVAVVVVDPVGDATGPGVAELVAAAGATTTLVTPDPVAGDRLGRTGGLAAANARLDRAGVERAVFSRVTAVSGGRATLTDVHTGATRTVPCDLVVDCSYRLPDVPAWAGERPRAGDCVAPRTVAEAVREGRRAALALAAPLPAAVLDRPPRSGGADDANVPLDVGRSPAGPHPVAASGRAERSGGPADRNVPPDPAGAGSDGEPSPVRAGPAPEFVHPVNGFSQLLLTPLRVGAMELRNRIVFTAHLTGFAVDGLPTGRHAAYYAARAAGGAGMVITEEHSVLPDDRPYERLIRGHDPAVVPGQRVLTAAVHTHGAVVLAQLNHNGGQSSGMYSRAPVRAPSALADPMFREVAVAMTGRDVAEVVDGYARTAAHCADGGFDGVELQCSHASLLRMFLSPATNRRTDGYGGTPEKRARIVCEVVRAVRDVLGPDRVLGVRIGGDERIPGGLGPAEGVEHARLLEATGCVDYLSTSVGVATASLHLIEPSMHTPPGYAAYVPSAIRRAVSIPVLGVGRFTTPAQAAATLAAGDCDLVGVARGQIADPEFAARVADGRPVRRCVGCNQECVGRVGLNLPLGCAVNPRAGREAAPPRLPAAASTSVRATAPAPVPAGSRRGRAVAVVGGGPAGLSAAAGLARRGHRVTLYERGPAVGGQVALAALAPGRAEIGHVVRDLAGECARAGVRTVLGRDVRGPADLDDPDAIVLATGSVPSMPPWHHPGVVPVHDVLSGAATPGGRVLVVDELGFHQATSTAELLAARGNEVEIVTPALVAGQDLGPTLDREGFRRRAHTAGIGLGTDRVVLAVRGGPGALDVELLHHPTGAREHRRVAAVVHALSTTPCDRLWTTLRNGPVPVFRIGDCLAPRRIDAAVREGEEVAARCGSTS